MAGTIHTPSDHCQPNWLASGMATAAASADEIDIVIEITPITNPTCVGKSRLARAGNRTLLMAMAAEIISVPSNKSAIEGRAMRTTKPIISTTIEPINTRSMPQRFAQRAASGENRAKVSKGTAAITPDIVPDSANSWLTVLTIGPKCDQRCTLNKCHHHNGEQ